MSNRGRRRGRRGDGENLDAQAGEGDDIDDTLDGDDALDDVGDTSDDDAPDDAEEADVEQLEDDVDTENLDDDERITLDDAARTLLARPRRGHGPIARLYRGETRFDFVGRRRIWFAISTVIILAGILSIAFRGGLNLGIEFKGGTEWTIAAPGITQTQAVNSIQGTGVIDPTVQLLGTGSKQTLTVQSDLNKLSQSQQSTVSAKVVKALTDLTAGHSTNAANSTTTTSSSTSTTTSATNAAAAKSGATTTTTVPTGATPKTTADKVSITTVGPTWGSSITNKAIEALIVFFIVVAIYISIRFEPKMALAAFIAMVHDVLVAVGIYSIFNFQVTPDTVVAILTILGYSLYDTVVVFDRVRDNTKGIGSSGRMTYPQIINLSMNQTLARSINTSMVAILPVLAVLVIGAQLLGATTLQSYGLALFVGLLSGAYSSIFIASPVLCMMKQREDRWVSIADRLAKRGDVGAWYSAVDAATMGTAISVAASGQANRTGAGASKTRTKQGGLIRPGSASRSGSSGGGGTAVMDRPSNGSSAAGGSNAAGAGQAKGSSKASGAAPTPGQAPAAGQKRAPGQSARRKSRRKRKR